MSNLYPSKIPKIKKFWWISAILFSLAFIAVFAMPYIVLNPQKIDRFEGREFWIVTHVATGTMALLTGPIQFWLGWKRKITTHRKVGIIYLIAILISSLASFYLAFTTEISWIVGMGLGGLGVAWILTTGFAYIAILKRKITLHKEWMTRSYIVTMGFVFFRLFIGIASAIGIGTMTERLEVASWICWALPLLLGEVILQSKKLFAK